jgi:hypothetical protein
MAGMLLKIVIGIAMIIAVLYAIAAAEDAHSQNRDSPVAIKPWF